MVERDLLPADSIAAQASESAGLWRRPCAGHADSLRQHPRLTLAPPGIRSRRSRPVAPAPLRAASRSQACGVHGHRFSVRHNRNLRIRLEHETAHLEGTVAEPLPSIPIMLSV